MEFDVLPGPSLPELARTALARTVTATVSAAIGPGGLAGAAGPGPAVPGPVPVRSTRDGSPLLLPAAGSPLAHWLAASPDPVRVSLPAGPPFSALRLTGTARPVAASDEAGITACVLAIGSIEFTGGGRARVPVEEYRAARPDPLWRVAPGVLRHLEHAHMGDLVHCVRAHGMTRADWVIPRELDRYGLELLVLATDGVAAVRLSFPSGPVTSINDVPVSLRAALTCRCQAGPGHRQPRGDGDGARDGGE
ncbi:MAG: DUF2470 domain-containing protein [Trebonia sp.]